MIEIVNPLTGAEILAEFHNQPMDGNEISLEKMIDKALEDARPKWLPIKSAPRDGTPVDLWHWRGVRFTETWWDSEDECWSCCMGDIEFTHWMPITTPCIPCIKDSRPKLNIQEISSIINECMKDEH